MNKVFFIRHAKAGDRAAWTDPDHLRPLTGAGRKQAEALVQQLHVEEIARILTSHYLRCAQTVEPLAKSLGLELETHDALVEGAPTSAALELIQGAHVPIALCTHGDVMENVIGHLRDSGVDGADPSLGKKGSTWILSVDASEVVQASYVEPPS